MPRSIPTLFALLAAVGCGSSSVLVAEPAQSGEPIESEPVAYSFPSGNLDAVLSGGHRTGEERARDRYRHPKATLEHFGLEPDQTVLEIWPGRGWYTKILAPYLRDDGKLIVANVDPEAEGYVGQMARDFTTMLEAMPTLYDQVEVVGLYPGNLLRRVPSRSVDLVLLPRTVHNWIRRDEHDPRAYFRAIARVLKPGGVLGVVQHRAPADHPQARTGEAGYLSEELVIELVEAAGLRLVERSEINANPDDSHDHPEGVWSLPPSLRGPEDQRGRYRRIGESDRMTLRFEKPE